MLNHICQGSNSLKSYYNIVFDQQFSPFGKHLATCDIFGQIAVFRYYPIVCTVEQNRNDVSTYSLSSALDSTNQSSGKNASRLLKGTPHIRARVCCMHMYAFIKVTRDQHTASATPTLCSSVGEHRRYERGSGRSLPATQRY